jgi:hypothetical protein
MCEEKNPTTLKEMATPEKPFNSKGSQSYPPATEFADFERVRIITKNMGHHRFDKMLVDMETGEILGKWHECTRPELFPDGCNAIIREAMFSRDVYPGGAEKVFVKNPDGKLYFDRTLSPDELNFGPGKGNAKGRGRTKGKPAQIKFKENISNGKLNDTNIGFLFRLSKLSRYNTGLLASKTKPLSLPDIYTAMEVSERTGRTHINALMAVGMVVKREDGYYINRKYITKG